MVLPYLRKRRCVVCCKRGDHISKNCVDLINNSTLQLAVNNFFNISSTPDDIICRKHIIYMQEKNNYMADKNINLSGSCISNEHDSFYPDYDVNHIDEINHREDSFNCEAVFENDLPSNKHFDNENSECNERVTITIPRAYASHKRCFICKKRSGNQPFNYMKPPSFLSAH